MDKSDITLARMRIFARVAERGSLSAVARELGRGQASISRALSELETALGVMLISRTTRRVSLTEEDCRYLGQCQQILRLVDQSAENVRAARRAPSGTVRISCTSALGVRHISRLLFSFQALYPDIRVDLNLTDERINLVKNGVDIALRLGPLTDNSSRLHSLGESTRLIVGAPDYLASNGTPHTPGDLAAHNFIRMSNVAGSGALVLTGPDGSVHSVSVSGNLLVDHGLAAREAFLAGRGLGPAHRWLVDDLLECGALVQLLPGYELPATPLNMLIVPGHENVTRVRLLIDYLVAEVRSLPGIRKA